MQMQRPYSVRSNVTYFASNFFARSAHMTLYSELNSKHAWQFKQPRYCLFWRASWKTCWLSNLVRRAPM